MGADDVFTVFSVEVAGEINGCLSAVGVCGYGTVINAVVSGRRVDARHVLHISIPSI